MTASPARVSACPACSVAPMAEDIAAKADDAEATILLALPTIHCAGCISTVERGLNADPAVHSARVNLTMKRVSIAANPGVTAADMIGVLDGLGYEAHELDASILSTTATEKAGRELLMRLGVAGFAMMNIMLLSVAVWSGAADATRDLFHWISALIALPTIAFSGQPFFKNAYAALRAGRLNMDVPISLAILLAFVSSVLETLQSGEHAYFDAAVSLTFFLLAGRYLDFRTRAVARSAAEELAALEVPRALRVTTSGEETVAIAELVVGDIVRVKPGGRVPVDGVIVRGQSEVDRSLLTGETLPVFAGVGRDVSAGEVNLTGPLDVRVTAAGEQSSLHQMADLVAVAESAKNKYTSLADRAAKLYAPGVHILAALAFAGWLIYTWGDMRQAMNIAVAVLIITCPCALGLAVPAVTTAASGRLFKHGMLIKNGTALERLAEVDTVVFDKTGTLTKGAPTPTNLTGFDAETLAVGLALADSSSHPLARAFAKEVRAMGIAPAAVRDIQEVPGYGVQGIMDGHMVHFGRAEWVGASQGATMAVWMRVGATPAVEFTFADHLRDGAAELVADLKSRGIDVKLLSGDGAAPVADLAARVGIDDYRAGVLPAEKAAVVQDLTEQGRHVLMVGDGLNDTAALTAAYVSISPASALDAARVASDIVLLGGDLEPVGAAIGIARQATKRIHENFTIASLYNVIAVPIAIVGFATPLAAALAMSASSITVSLNALRLRK